MENKELNAKIKRAFENAAPNTPDAVLSEYEKKKGNVMILTENKKTGSWVRKLSAIAAVFVLLIAGCVGFLYYNNNYAVASTVSLDINPSIEIRVNQKERVLDVTALNEDGRIVIGDMDFSGSDLEITVNALIGSMLRYGYLNEMANSILVSVDGGSENQNSLLKEKLSQEISALLETDTFSGAVLSQTVTADSELRKLADTYGITVGKAQLVQQIMALSPLYTFEGLAGLSINELNLLLESHSTAEENPISSVGSASDKAYIGTDAAVEQALTHASLSYDEITSLKTELDWDDGMMVYEVEFHAGGYEYEYEINAKTGDILKIEKEREDDDIPSVPSGADDGNYISAEKAKEIACSHAGIAISDIWDFDIDFERDNGLAVYELDFKSDGYEYDYEINAVTGDILKSERERDDDAPAVPSGSDDGNYITAEKAKEIACAHAGIAISDIWDFDIDFERDNGLAVYELDFKSDGYEYDYEINAVTGDILRSEKERS